MLSAGQSLRVPAGVQANRHAADTHLPYDPANALGDIHPTTPKPPKPDIRGMSGASPAPASRMGWEADIVRTFGI